MKNLIIVCCLLICSSAYAQNHIKGYSTYFPQEDSVSLSISELNYLISRSYIICCKIDTLDDSGMIKTIQIVSTDTSFKFVGAYIESNIFFPQDIISNQFMGLKCEYALIDSAGLYESYELDSLGRDEFEIILNLTPLVCIEDERYYGYY